MHAKAQRRECSVIPLRLCAFARNIIEGNNNMTLWKKNTDPLKEVNQFTVGNDRDFDLQLAPFDVLGSIAHATMLDTSGLLTKDEKEKIINALQEIYRSIGESKFTIHDEAEDIHSQIELLLTKQLGDSGKKIHSARSRNDQV